MILFYTEEITPRIEYIAQVIFGHILKTEVQFTNNSAEFRKSELPKINYSYEKFDDEFYLKPHRLLYCKALISTNFKSVWYNGEKYFFESSSDSDLPFDMFAASFYLITRYEEYTEKERGKFKRYQAEKSILFKYNLLKKPIVNIWAKLLAHLLSEKYPTITFPENKFSFLSSIDIDNAWAYLNKGFWRSSGAILKALLKGETKEATARFKVLSGSIPDPYDTYTFLDSVLEKNKENVKFFFLIGDYAKYDKNNSFRNKNFRKLIKETSSKYEVGIHPSFASSKKKGVKKLQIEKTRIEGIIEKNVTSSRQHFLRLNLPKTYRRLIKLGVNSDYTMGYSSQSGFRAGICTPFPFYDLKKEETTNLMLIPFQVMDVTLRDYMGLNAAQALQEIMELMQEVKNVGGTFVSVWHNETLNNSGGWEGFREVFEKMNKTGFEWANE